MKKSNSGFTLVELLVVIGILGILMGALFPAISAAMLSANSSAMSMRGRKLFEGITQCNIDREGKGLPSMWPHQTEADGLSDDTDDIAGQTYGTSTDYFKEVFDMDNYGTDSWDPYVKSCDISVLSGSGVPAVSGSELTQNNVAWTVASGMTSEMEDIVPAMVTRNMDTTQFAVSGQNDMSQNKEKITLGETFAQPFGDKACIVVHKGGSVETIKAKDCKLYIVYGKQSVTVPSGITMQYIQP